jgi:dynein light intermediate chain
MNAPESLVKFNTPFEKINVNEEGVQMKDNQEILKEYLKDASAAGSDANLDLDTLLNIILPPREWVNECRTYIQYVSHTPASREDVINLQKLLDERLSARQAKESGICPIREELYAECFDEIIRQVTIDCPERGILLMRTRDEIKMTIAAYQTLYKSAVAFGMRKQTQAEKGKKELREKMESLQARKADLEKTKGDLIAKKRTIEKRIDEQRGFEKNKRKAEIDFLEYQNQHLKQFFQAIDSNKP